MTEQREEAGLSHATEADIAVERNSICKGSPDLQEGWSHGEEGVFFFKKILNLNFFFLIFHHLLSSSSWPPSLLSRHWLTSPAQIPRPRLFDSRVQHR